jgi:hypothetical protein
MAIHTTLTMLAVSWKCFQQKHFLRKLTKEGKRL